MNFQNTLKRFDPGKEAKRIEGFIKEKKELIGSSNVVIGLSGGIDSSVTAALSLRALPGEEIEVLFLPEKATPTRDSRDVKKLEQKFGFRAKKINIDGIFSTFEGKLGMEMTELSRANLKARIRMTMLYSLANQKDGLVLGTGNLSEWLLGYFTKYGDGATDIAPIVHLYKTEVKGIARHLSIPESIIEKPPSAGLWKGQTDEEELGGSYEQIDRILYCKKDLDLSEQEALEKLDLKPELVRNIYEMVSKSRHKREIPEGLDRTTTEENK